MTPRPHPYVVQPYSAIISPLIDMLEQPLIQRIGLSSSLEPSARQELSEKMTEHGTRYLDWVWKQRPKAPKASPRWKPYHHGEAKPPLTAQKPANTANQPIRFVGKKS